LGESFTSVYITASFNWTSYEELATGC